MPTTPPHPSALPHLLALRRSGALADVAIAVDGAPHPLPAHAAVLAAASGYFHALLTGAGVEMGGGGGGEASSSSPRLRRVSLTGLPPTGIDAALDFAYSGGGVTPEPDTAAAALRVADYLDMPALCRAAATTLSSTLTPATALDALGLASTCGGAAAGDLYDAALHLAHARFDEAAASPSLVALPPTALLALLSGDGAAAASEADVLKAGAAWLAAAPVERAAHARAVVDAVRVPPATLAAAPTTTTLLASLPPAAAAALRVALADASSTPRGGGGPPHPPRARAAGALLWSPPAATTTGGAPSAPRKPLPRRTPRGARRPAPPRPCPLLRQRRRRGWGGATWWLVQRLARLPFHSNETRPCLTTRRHRLRSSGGRCPPPTVARIHAAAAALGDDLMVAGGRPGVGPELASVELWRPGASRWSPAPPLNLPRTAAAAAAVGGRVYVVGGQTGKTTHGGGEWFDGGAGGRWLPLGSRSHLTTPRKYATAVEWGGRAGVVGRD